MTRDQFWKIIEQSRSEWNSKVADGNMDRQCNELSELLNKLDRDELVSFATHYYNVDDEAYHWNLWAAAYIMGGGCSDDGFIDFRAWLISMGKEVFDAALKDPETLAENGNIPGVECFFFEQFSYVYIRVYEGKFDVEFPDLNLTHSDEPAGEPFSEDEDELSKRFPKLFKEFWDDA